MSKKCSGVDKFERREEIEVEESGKVSEHGEILGELRRTSRVMKAGIETRQARGFEKTLSYEYSIKLNETFQAIQLTMGLPAVRVW